MPAHDEITVRGAREHNLANIDVTFPRDALVVVTGVSGSGKSSFAFDTVYAEGQRRYIESLSSYARQFLGGVKKPDVDSIEGLSPAIAIDQKSTSKNPRSTVGTITEIHDYLRLLFARVGTAHCPDDGTLLGASSAQATVGQLATWDPDTRILVLAPVVVGRKGTHADLLEDLAAKGFPRLRINGVICELPLDEPLEKNKKHNIDVVVDRAKAGSAPLRLTQSIETALGLADGTAIVDAVAVDGKRLNQKLTCSTKSGCPTCGKGWPELEPRLFSFNAPFGACHVCEGLGAVHRATEDLVIPDPSKSIDAGAVIPFQHMVGQGQRWGLMTMCVAEKIPTRTPWSRLTDEQRHMVMYGGRQEKNVSTYSGGNYNVRYSGVIAWLTDRRANAASDAQREWAESFMREVPCEECGGARLAPYPLAVLVAGKTIAELARMDIATVAAWFDELELDGAKAHIAERVIKEIRARLTFLNDVGLRYLTLDRASRSLSGGEAQRIRLASQVGSGLTGVLYVLDEPSIGLHQRDNRRLLDSLVRLRDLGNTVLIVEHDTETIEAADFIVDIGPGAGVLGGELVYAGDVAGILDCPDSLTGAYLSGRMSIPTPPRRRKAAGWVKVRGASEHNLRKVTAKFPVGAMSVVTGVSGSGKSTLVGDILHPVLANTLNKARHLPGAHVGVDGLDHFDRVIDIDQAPIGRTPRSNPATYTGAFDNIRKLYAELPESQLRGYKPGRFSFNVANSGRCEGCQGEGTLKIEMSFLPDVYVPCETCDGKRFNDATLEVLFKGRSIADVLAMPISEATVLFENQPPIKRTFDALCDVGLGYLSVGHPATHLSGGEAQRVKLAAELRKRATGRTIYLLDEPTTGLHFDDVAKLIVVLNRLVDAGNTIIIIEHNMDVIRCADWLVDLGPEGGTGGGQLVAQGTPEQVAAVPESHTGACLAELLAPATKRRT